ncbi:phosphatidylserine decarboxylase family protein [Trinickia caryophylli]|uniref:Phosphatidylserine decarboxylase n=1 Tax=Trinickia caryophylli TaxID=28094 RepID=A0A1X7GG45_TRICW|nr:phosphatidylserine decarboxylase family protein [Trinickia caryophylli]PMS08749.1 phosphatidylserine decarboxylase [Trinickia caryophylli]TRX13903.1 phosphatidylserine decarboxylase family protein [Trinickia caryophylli]WQE15494.1 phosphatidylserine decarboxylase family protein [Trinickia caryophylli]SMF69180.1 phosphatidylserine decarboxylase [Trinickia caryophylli]GLU33760.1 phosphatidylserine decarboxylase [Trinickia caryophylli]
MAERSSGAIEARRRLGEWLPSSEDTLAEFRESLAARARERAAKAQPASVVRAFSALVHDDPVLRMNLTRAIDEALEAGYRLGYASIDELMIVLDYILTYAPPYSEKSLIHCPINALLDWPMCMPSGYAVFRDPAFNAQLKRVLNVWCGFLSGPHSRMHLHDASPEGWFSEQAVRKIGMPQFVCSPEERYWGFASWNAFFTRQFKAGARPVAAPGDNRVIVSACEAAPYNISYGARQHDRFWLKSQPYSLQEIFTADQRQLAERFAGGTVYQAYLSGHNYHRWHAPVGGTITKAYLVDGSYYSDLEAEGVDPSGLNDSQGYITAVAARAIIVIDCDDPAIGEVGCVFVGMAEVSSCVVEALPGQHVEKGDEIGFFQYGGSTYCLVFRPDVIDRFVVEPPYGHEAKPVHLNAALAQARTR